MVLFANLKKAEDNESISTSSTTSSLALPTVLQLYTSKPLLFPGTTDIPSYAYMSYQAVSLAPPESIDALNNNVGGLRTPKKAVSTEPSPDLGVWTCRVSSQNVSILDSLLQLPKDNISGSPLPVIVLTVDLSDPAMVEPTLTRLQQALVRHLISRLDDSSGNDVVTSKGTSEVATTSLAQLQTAQFGLAPEDKKDTSTNVTTNEGDANVKIMLLIAVTHESPTTAADATEDFMHKQTNALFMYHLRRYARLLNATLCFVGRETLLEDPNTVNTSTSSENGSNNTTASLFQPVMSYKQLGVLLKEFAQGKTPTLEGLRDELQLPAWPASSPVQWWYGPSTDVVEIDGEPNEDDEGGDDNLEDLLLRRAQFPGHWDASKDSLWKVFPTRNESSIAVTSNINNDQLKTSTLPGTAQDQDWLAELRDSLAVENVTTPPRPPKETPGSAKKTPKDTDVSNFFESLLKKS